MRLETSFSDLAISGENGKYCFHDACVCAGDWMEFLTWLLADGLVSLYEKRVDGTDDLGKISEETSTGCLMLVGVAQKSSSVSGTTGLDFRATLFNLSTMWGLRIWALGEIFFGLKKSFIVSGVLGTFEDTFEIKFFLKIGCFRFLFDFWGANKFLGMMFLERMSVCRKGAL